MGEYKVKFTDSYVRSQFGLAGYEMLGEYVRSVDPVRFRCDKGHEHQMSFGHFRAGRRCGFCTGRYIDPQIVKTAFESEGYQLLDGYKNNSTKMRFICPQGHEYQMSWQKFQQGRRCGLCATTHPLSSQAVKAAFEEEGYQLLDRYKNNSTKMRFICPQGHEHQMSWEHFQRGTRCLFCRRDEGSACQRKPQEEVRLAFEAKGWTLLDQYKGAHEPMLFRCDKGHEHQINWSSFSNGNGCGKCDGKHKTQEEVRLAFEAKGWILLDQYKGAHEPMRFRCDKGHEHQIPWTRFQQGGGCGKCHAYSRKRNLTYISGVELNIIRSVERCMSRHQIKGSWNDFHDGEYISFLAGEIVLFYKMCPDFHHVDHIVPASWFDLTDPVSLAKCWNLKNLRYLPALQNISRSNRMTREEYLTLKRTHREIIKFAKYGKIPV